MIPPQQLDENTSALLERLNSEVVQTSRTHAWVSGDVLRRTLNISTRGLEKATSALILGRLGEVEGTYRAGFRVRRRLSAYVDGKDQHLQKPREALRNADLEYLRHWIAVWEEDLGVSRARGQGTHAQTLATRIAEYKAALEMTEAQQTEETDSDNCSSRSGVFISYRRVGGAEVAQSFRLALENDYDVFLDVGSMPTGQFDDSVLEAIETRENFVLVLSAGALLNPANYYDTF